VNHSHHAVSFIAPHSSIHFIPPMKDRQYSSVHTREEEVSPRGRKSVFESLFNIYRCTAISKINKCSRIILAEHFSQALCTDCYTCPFKIRHCLIILVVCFFVSLVPKLPSFAPPFLLFEVPKKLLQEQGPRPPVYPPPPGAHDPNIVGDSPPEGSSAQRPDAVPGEQSEEHMRFF